MNAVREEKIVLFERPKIAETFDSIHLEKPRRQIRNAIKHGFNVLVTGETGTGKSSIVRSVANYFPEQTFVETNISSICDSIFESELFGHVKGSFTGAIKNRSGYLQEAQKGILFLDEIGDLPLNLQPKILSVTGDGFFSRVGESQKKQFNGICIFASNQDIAKLVKEGKFRSDLYYRICECVVNIPPLRKRLDSLPRMCNYFLDDLSKSIKDRPKKNLSLPALEVLYNYHWPGNLRELRSVLVQAFLTCEGDVIWPDDLIIAENRPKKQRIKKFGFIKKIRSQELGRKRKSTKRNR